MFGDASPIHLSRSLCVTPRIRPQVYEAAVAALKRAGATAQELTTVARLQPDRSVRVKAKAGLGRVRMVQLETLRLQLAKVCRWAPEVILAKPHMMDIPRERVSPS